MGGTGKRRRARDGHRRQRKGSGARGHQHVRLAKARDARLTARTKRTYALIGADGALYSSTVPGTLGGHRMTKIYGRLDCRSALRAISRGGYVKHRVFFPDEATAVSAGFRPCAVCMPDAYALWKASR